MGERRHGSLLRRADKMLEMALYYISALLLLIISGTVFYAVLLRYVFNEPPLWAEDAPRVFFLWMTYIGIAVAVCRGQNIRVTHFIDKFAPAPRVVLEVFMHILVLIMIATLFWYSFPVLELQLGGKMLSTGWSYAWPYSALPVGCVLMTFYQTRLMLRAIGDYQRRVGRGG